MTEESIKFTVITVCKNEEKYIEETIKSVISQSYKNIQFIIIDGVSSDNTLQIIDKYKNNIDVLISEQDDGIYSAMNKGLKYATGDFICFINANDSFYDENVLFNLTKIINTHKNVDFIFGEGDFVDDAKTVINYTDYSKLKNGYDFFDLGFFNHQSVVYKKELFDKYGQYSKRFKIIADNEFNLKCVMKYKCPVFYTNLPLSRRMINGFAQRQRKITIKEMDILKKQYFPFYYNLFKPIKVIKYFSPFCYKLVGLILRFYQKKHKFNFVD